VKQQFCLINDNVKRNVVSFIESLPVDRRSPVIIEAREESRTDKQNRLMWPLLKDLSDQVSWYGEKLEQAEWKDLITVLVSQMQNPEREQKSAPGINGGRVYFGFVPLNPASATWSRLSRRSTGSVPSAM
jgi:hypothetical protein